MKAWNGFSLACLGMLVAASLLPGLGCKRAQKQAPAESPPPAAPAEAPAPAEEPVTQEVAPSLPAEEPAPAPETDEVTLRLREVQGSLLGTVERLQALARVEVEKQSKEFMRLRGELLQRMAEGEALMGDWVNGSSEQRRALKASVDAFLAQAQRKLEEVRAYGGSAKVEYEKAMQAKLDLAAEELKILQQEGAAAGAEVGQVLEQKWEIARDRLAEVRARAGDDWADTKEEMDAAAHDLDAAMPEPAPEQAAEKNE